MIVSIIIPVYNVAPYIEKCLNSVINQTTTEGIECIIVDDCATDNSMDIAKELVAGYNGTIKFNIIHHKYNRGLSAARNTGIDAATGKYVFFLDSDDWIDSDCMILMIESAKKYPDVQVVFGGALSTSGGYEYLDYTKKELPEYSCNRDELQLSMLKRFDFGMTAWNKLILREFINKHKLRFVEGLIHEDEVWNLQISQHIISASFIHSNTYVYNIREHSIIAQASKELKKERLLLLWEEMVKTISGYRKNLQIKAICTYILTYTWHDFPDERKSQLAKLFLQLAIKSHNFMSLLLVTQGLFALCLKKRYYNAKIARRIML